MNNKQAKRIRNVVGYNPNTHRTDESSYDMEDTSKIVGAEVVGVNADGTPKYEVIRNIQCTFTLKDDNIRKVYKKAKQQFKQGL